MCYLLHHENVICARFYYSHLQVTAYIIYRSPQKITNFMVRHLTRLHFLEFCWYKVLLWHCYITKEELPFRNKVTKIDLAEENLVISIHLRIHTFLGYVFSLEQMTKTSFEVIFRSCEKGSAICLCDSWSLLGFHHLLLTSICWLWIHVQGQQQKNKAETGGWSGSGGGFWQCTTSCRW